MSLLMTPDNTFEVILRYQLVQGEVKFVESPSASAGDIQEDKFVFRRPNWKDTKTILASSVIGGDATNIDPISYMESRIRVLMKSWTIKDEEGRPLPIDKIDRLAPAVIIRLSSEMDKVIGSGMGSVPQ